VRAWEISKVMGKSKVKNHLTNIHLVDTHTNYERVLQSNLTVDQNIVFGKMVFDKKT
jgi:hypothetical protein